LTTPDKEVPAAEAPTAENPILGETELPRWSVSAPRPVPKANTRLVFVDGKGRVHAPAQPMTLSEVVWGGLRRMYEVDMREYPAKFHAQVPCREKGFSFDVDFELSWRVHDPERIVRDGRTDVERALKRALAGASTLPEGISVRNCALTLSLGAEADAHFKSRTIAEFATETRHIEHAATIDKARHDKVEVAAQDEIEVLKGELRAQHRRRQLEEQQHLATLKSQVEIAEVKAQLAVAELKQQLERQQEEHRLEIEAERQRAAIKVKAERMDFYGKALESGSVASLIPIFLDEHPAEVGQLLNLLVAQHRDNRENAIKVLEAMLEAGMVNGRDLDETRRAALQNLLRGLSTSALGSSIDEVKPAAIERTRTAVEEVEEVEDAEDADDDDPDD
jgi:hypothetical protein